MKNKVLEIIKTNNKYNCKRMAESYFIKYHNNLYVLINNKYRDFSLPFSGKLYLIINDLNEPPVCKICGNLVRFKKFSEGFSKYCSVQCIGKDKEIQKKRENTTLKNYGGKYTLSSPELKEKVKQTNLKKYGVEHPQQLEEIKEKAKKTNLKKYGVEHHLKLESQRKKQIETNLERYGVDSPMKSEEIRNKTKKTNLERYGVESPTQNEEIKEKIKKTNLERYGVEYTILDEDVKKKIKETNLERYGENVYSKTNEYKKRVKKTKKEKYGDENYNNIDKIKQTNLEKYGFENASKSEIVKSTIIKKRSDLFKNKYSEILGISVNDIIVNGDNLIIKNYCKIHNDFNISKSLLYSRIFNSIVENICTKCNPIDDHTSIKENEIKNFIKTLNVNIFENDTEILNGRELDIYIPSHNLAIEFNGLYHHSSLFKDKDYHLNKTKLCEENNIQLLHIFEDEWMFKKEIVKSMIRSKLNLTNEKIYARKCRINEIDYKTYANFLNKNHIQGEVKCKIRIGLFHENELVSVMSFEKMRKNLGNENNSDFYFTLNRFCNKINTQVIGGASKLLNFFMKKYKPEKIISFADRRYSQGNLYVQLGFNLTHINKPTYMFFNRNQKYRYHRFKYRKEIVVKNGWLENDETVDEALIKQGIYKIYDSGNMKFELTIT